MPFSRMCWSWTLISSYVLFVPIKMSLFMMQVLFSMIRTSQCLFILIALVITTSDRSRNIYDYINATITFLLLSLLEHSNITTNNKTLQKGSRPF